MDLLKVIDDLIEQRDRLNIAIETLRAVVAGPGAKRRGRPPKWMKAGPQLAAGVHPPHPAFPLEVRTRKPLSDATKRRMAKAQKKRWRARKAAGHKTL